MCGGTLRRRIGLPRQQTSQLGLRHANNISTKPPLSALQVEEETSSANYGSSRQETPSASHADALGGDAGGHAGGGSMLPGMVSVEQPSEGATGEETNKKDAAAADDLRELAAKGVCAPLWRTSQPVQPVRGNPILTQRGCRADSAAGHVCPI